MRSSSSHGYDTPVRRSIDEGRDFQSEPPGQFTVSPIQYDIADFLGSHEIDDFEEILYQKPLTGVETQTPSGMLAYALSIDNPELNFPWSGKKRRLNLKQGKSMAETLWELQQDPLNAVLPKMDWNDRIRGRNTFRGIYCSLLDTTVMLSREIVSRLWRETSDHCRNAYAFLSHVHQLLYTNPSCKNVHAKVRIALPDGSKHECAKLSADNVLNPLIAETFGALLTYHSKFGLDDPLLIAWEKNMSSENILEKLKGQRDYEAKFREFKDFIMTMMLDHRFKNCAVAMELCMNGQRKGRIHFHGFLGQECSYNGWMSHPVKAQLRRNHLIFNNVFPNVQVMKCFGRRGMEMPTAHGLYYCMAPKVGQMFAFSTLVPFKDSA
jgi:hypothetical protein